MLPPFAPGSGAPALPLVIHSGAQVLLPVRLALGDLPETDRSGMGGAVERQLVMLFEGGVRLGVPVTAVLSAGLAVAPTDLDLGVVPTGRRALGSVNVTSLGDRVTVGGIEVQPGGPSAMVLPAVPGTPGVTVAFAWGPFREPGNHAATATLSTDAADCAAVPIRVRVSVVAAVVAEPPSLQVEAADAQGNVVRRVRVRRVDGGAVRVSGISLTSDEVRARLLPQADLAVQEIEVTVPTAGRGPGLDATLSLRLADPGAESLAIPIRVRPRH